MSWMLGRILRFGWWALKECYSRRANWYPIISTLDFIFPDYGTNPDHLLGAQQANKDHLWKTHRSCGSEYFYRTSLLVASPWWYGSLLLDGQLLQLRVYTQVNGVNGLEHSPILPFLGLANHSSGCCYAFYGHQNYPEETVEGVLW